VACPIMASFKRPTCGANIKLEVKLPEATRFHHVTRHTPAGLFLNLTPGTAPDRNGLMSYSGFTVPEA
jgi:hypothetical protein